MSSSVYYNDNLLILNNFITKKFGSDLNIDMKYNIFSYLKPPINGLQTPPSDFSTNIIEDNIMLYIILNDYYLKNNTGDYNNFIKNILKTDESIFKLNDFSLINYNTNFYDMNFNIITDPNELYDIDLSYYANPIIYKYYFLFDILYQLYIQISKINTIDKSYVIEFLKKPITFNIRYYSDDSYNWSYTNNYTITIQNLYEIKNSLNLNIKSSNQSYESKNITYMFSIIQKTLIKHLNFIENLDIIQSINIALFYKICRLMLNNTIIASLNYLLYLNTKTLNASILNDKPTNDVPLYNNTITIQNLNTYNNFIKINPSSQNINYILFNDVNDNIYTQLPEPIYKLDNTTLFSSLPDYNTTNNNYRFIYIPYLYTTIGDKEIVTLIKKPKIYNFKYVNNLTINLGNDSGSYYINTISGVKPNTRYMIKLHNFTTIKPQNIFNLKSTPTSSVTDDGNIFIWDNLNKLLIFTVSSSVKNSTYNVLSVFADKIYMFNYIRNEETNNTKISLPTLSANPAINNYGILLNTSDDFDILNTSTNNSLVKTFTSPSDFLQYFVSYAYKTPNFGYIYSINNNFYKNSLNTINTIKGKFIDNYTYINVVSNSISNVKALEISYYDYDNNDNFKDIIKNGLSGFVKKDNINTSISFKIKLSDDGQTSMIYPTTYEKYDENIDQYNTIINFCIANLSTTIDNNSDNLLDITNKNSDNILINMDKIENNNKNIRDDNAKMKHNYSYYDSTDKKIVYTNTIEIITIVIFTIAIITNVYIIMVGNIEYYLIIILIFILLIINLFYINIKLRSEYVEYFNYNDDEDSKTGHPNYSTREDFNNLLKKLITNMKNVKINTTSQIIKPRMKKELSKNDNKRDISELYNKVSKNDVNILRLIYKKKLAQLSLLLSIGIIFTILTFLYLLVPNYKNYIILFGFILISLSIYIFYFFIKNNSRTDMKKSYWLKPSKETTDNLY
jgi:hypothetical protein